VLTLPPEFVRTTVAREGDTGAAWLAGLPATVAELLERWECVPEGEVLHAGSAWWSRCGGRRVVRRA
jgi:streptomycin 6-kinase